MQLHAFRTLRDFGSETLKFYHIYYRESPDTNHSIHCLILQLCDSRTCTDEGIDVAIENMKLAYREHIGFHKIKLDEDIYKLEQEKK